MTDKQKRILSENEKLQADANRYKQSLTRLRKDYKLQTKLLEKKTEELAELKKKARKWLDYKGPIEKQ